MLNWFLILLCASSISALALDKYPTLQAVNETYTNVTITDVTPTKLFITHSKGMTTVELTDLPPEIQQKYQDRAAAAAKKRKQAQARPSYSQTGTVSGTTFITNSTLKYSFALPAGFQPSPPRLKAELAVKVQQLGRSIAMKPEVADYFGLVQNLVEIRSGS